MRVLVHTDVVKYLEFKAVDGSYVLVKGAVSKVPATDWEALRSPLMGLFEKRRAGECVVLSLFFSFFSSLFFLSSQVLTSFSFFPFLHPAKFFSYCQAVDVADAATWQGRDLRALNMWELYREFGLDSQTVDFVGHAIALETSDRYMTRPALPTVAKVKLYYESVVRYEGLTSPYIYPLYGLGELPQAFARLAAVHGGTYMLDRPDVEVLYDEQVRGGGGGVDGWVGGCGKGAAQLRRQFWGVRTRASLNYTVFFYYGISNTGFHTHPPAHPLSPPQGAATGVTAGGETARAKLVVGDPSYFPQRCIKTGRVVRAIAILSHPLAGCGEAHSAQVIIPQKQVRGGVGVLWSCLGIGVGVLCFESGLVPGSRRARAHRPPPSTPKYLPPEAAFYTRMCPRKLGSEPTSILNHPNHSPTHPTPPHPTRRSTAARTSTSSAAPLPTTSPRRASGSPSSRRPSRPPTPRRSSRPASRSWARSMRSLLRSRTCTSRSTTGARESRRALPCWFALLICCHLFAAIYLLSFARCRRSALPAAPCRAPT